MRTKKVAVITGAASGIGKSVVHKLLKKNFIVWATDINASALEQLTEECASRELRTQVVDVTNSKDLEALASQVEKVHGTLDVWINNAGISRIQDFTKQSAVDWEQVLNVNLLGVVHGCRAALKVMEGRGKGTIINMASVAGHVAAPFMSAYCASKHAVVGFTRSLQTELELRNVQIKVVMVSPGFVNTPIINRGAEAGFPEWLSGLLSTPDKVANTVVRAITAPKAEILTTLNGHLMLAAFKTFPRMTMRSSKLLLTKSLKDALLNRYNLPDRG